jgi:hypothetical protein
MSSNSLLSSALDQHPFIRSPSDAESPGFHKRDKSTFRRQPSRSRPIWLRGCALLFRWLNRFAVLWLVTSVLGIGYLALEPDEAATSSVSQNSTLETALAAAGFEVNETDETGFWITSGETLVHLSPINEKNGLLSISAPFEVDPDRISLRELNEWNRDTFWVKAFFSDADTMVLEMNVRLDPQNETTSLITWLLLYSRQLDQFDEFVEAPSSASGGMGPVAL